ncbi:unnamed protein product [Blepharisma stoltei]|uniref:Uncharacterized protein n=1 Tax=Blepharisma stoltei TaxID=1481888 RepID=A0AAU9JIZ0_9CILI|nr:unnamed protein product [Blepharisma stoltei]
MKAGFSPSKTVTSIPKSFKRGEITGAISAAFGNPTPQAKPSTASQTLKKKLSMLRSRTIGRDTFLTEAEMNEVEEVIPTLDREEIKKDMTYEELINEVESITSGLQQRDDDLEELRRRIHRCDLGIHNQTKTTEGIRKNAKALDHNNKKMMKKFKSYADLPKYS